MIYLIAFEVIALIYFLVIIYRFYGMEMANETVQFWRHLQLWSAIIGGIVTCVTVIIAAYSQHKINSLESENKSTVSDTTNIQAETVIVNKGNENKTNVTMGDTYNVTSHNQSGGVTAGKIENLIVSEEDASGINPYENATIEQTGLTFKIRPKVGKWISPFVMIPLAEKDSVSIELSNASTTGTMYDVSMGVVDTNSDGSQWYGHVCGLNGGVPNPATKDFYYTVTFSSLPTRFIFGDRSSKNKVAFMWVRGR